jgi:hypothetical protein
VLLAAICAHGTVVVTVSPALATVTSGGTQKFTFKITGAYGVLAVNWSATAGTIDASGLFTAPVVTSKTIVTIKATRIGHHAFGTATVTVLPHRVRLTWDVDAQAVSYSIYRGASSGGPFALEASAITGTAYTDSTVFSGETYYYVATATFASGQESGYSNVAEAVIPSP